MCIVCIDIYKVFRLQKIFIVILAYIKPAPLGKLKDLKIDNINSFFFPKLRLVNNNTN